MRATRRRSARGAGKGAGLILQPDGTWWGVAVTLPLEMDNTSAEWLALAVGRWIAGCLRDLGARPGEFMYDAHAAEAVVEGCPHRQRDLLWPAIWWSVAPPEAVHCRAM